VVAWGLNADGQASVPPTLNGVIAVAGGDGHSVALKHDGTVVAWGLNADGQTTVPGGLSGVVAIAAGGHHTVALKADGTVVGWGLNADGQTSVPGGLSGVVAIAAGGDLTVALKNDGTVVAWGRTEFGQTSVPGGLSGVVAIAAGWSHTVVAKNDGTVVAWGSNSSGQITPPPGLSGVVSVAAGYWHTVALKNDGTVVAWGWGGNGQTNVPAGLSGVSGVAAGHSHTVAMKADGTVVAWEINNYGQSSVPAGLSGVSAIAAGRIHNVALALAPEIEVEQPAGAPLADGSSNVDFGTTMAVWSHTQKAFTVRNIGAAALTGLAVTIDGANPGDFSLDTTGMGAALAPGASTSLTVTFTPSSANARAAVLHIASSDPDENSFDVVLTGMGSNILSATYTTGEEVPVIANGFTATGNTVNVTLNYAPETGTSLTVVNNTGLGFINGTFDNLAQGQAVALMFNGLTFHFVANYHGGTGNDLVLQWAEVKLWAWGMNTWGELGDGTTTQRRTPVTVTTAGTILDGKTIMAAAAGYDQNLVLCTDGTMAAWGRNDYGQVGDGTINSYRNVPVAVSTAGTVLAGKTVVAIAAGFDHCLVLCSDSTLATWGRNDGGQLGTPLIGSQSKPVAVTTTGTPLQGRTVVAIAVKGFHNLALCSDGTLVTWGYNWYGQLGNGTTGNSNVPVAVTIAGTALQGRTVAAIAGGYWHSAALCSDGTLAAWGYNIAGQLGDGTTVNRHTPMAVITTGTVLQGRTVAAIAGGDQHTLALCSDGTLAAWGNNESGQLGDSSIVNRTTAVTVSATGTALQGKTVVGVSMGEWHSLALCSDGTVATWGANEAGQLGDNSTMQRNVPVAVNLSALGVGERFIVAQAGGRHGLGLVAAPPVLPPAPEIVVEQPVGQDIPDGSDQDFGLVAVSTNASLTFTIKNTGAADLTGLTITKDGPNVAEFIVTATPTAPVVGPSGSTTFTVQFAPDSAGWKTATVHIANNDLDEAPFDIRLTGRGRSTMANFLGGDRFDDNGVNPAAWDSDIVNGTSGVLTEINQRLEYTEPTGNSLDSSAALPWILNNGSYTASWEARMDVHLSNATLPNDGYERRIGLLIFAGDYGAETRFELENNNGTLRRRLSADDEDGFGTGRGDHATTSTDAALRVTFDAVSKMLTFYYDENGATGGYSWTQLFTTDTDAPGSNWGLNSTSRFQLAVYGESSGVAVASGEVYADNLALDGLFVNPLTVDFDSQAHDQPVYDYLAQHGITITDESFPSGLRSMDHDLIYGGGVVQATTLDKYLSASGPPAGVPYSFSMNFAAPMWRVTVDNCGILVPSINASWTMTAYNALGQQVAQTQFTSPPATFSPSSFVLQPAAGETISSIVVASASASNAAFATGNWDTFTLYPNSVAEIGVEGPGASGLTDGGQAVDLGLVTAGSSGTPQTFTLRNTGLGDLTNLTILKDGPNAADFTVDTTGMTTTLAPGANTTFTVTFSPAAISARSAALHITSNDADENPFDITLTGTGKVLGSGKLAFGSSLTLVNEEAGTVNVQVVRTGANEGAVTVKVSTSNGTAKAPGDFTALSSYMVNFGVGETSKMVPVTINPDALGEPSETFKLTLSGPTGGATLGTPASTMVRIVDFNDVVPPTVTIKTPALNANVPEAAVNVTGTAADTNRVAMVQVSLNGADFVDATTTVAATGLTATYTAPLTPNAGSNTVKVRSVDSRGNVSAQLSRTFTYVVMRNLVVTVAPAGSGTIGAPYVAPYPRTISQQVGKSYTLTATPKAGNVFNGWTANSTTGTGITPAKAELPTLTFIHQEGLELTANFVGNPFVPEVIGTFNGLIMPSSILPSPGVSLPSNETVGMVTATVTGTGALTGRLYIDGLSLPFAGDFNNNGDARFGAKRAPTFSVVRTIKPSYDLALHLDLDTSAMGTNKLTGTLTQRFRSAIKSVSTLDADRAYSTGIPFNKTYTVHLPAKTQQGPGFTAADYPHGDGFATGNVNVNGTVALVGKLADGTPITVSAPLSKTHTWPLFTQLYPVGGVPKGSLAGQVTLDDTQMDDNIYMVGTDLLWFRPFQLVQWYPFGWDEGILVDLKGAEYAVPPALPATSVFPGPGSPPSALKPVDAVNGNVGLTFSDGLLAGVTTRNANISPINKVTKPTTNTDTNFSLRLTPTTGVIDGTFMHTDGTRTPFQGVIIQQGTDRGAYGHFLSTSPATVDYLGESGRVSVQAK